MPQRQPLIIRSLFYLLFGLCPLLFFTDLTRNPYYTQIVLLNGLTCIVWIIWLIQSWLEKELVWYWSDLDLPLGALMACSVLSWGFTFWNHPPLATSIYSEGSKGLIFLLVNTWLVYAAALRLRDPALGKHLLWIVYLVSAIAAIYGVAQYFGMEWIWPRQLNPYGSRPVSTFGNPNFMSSYLVLVLPVLVGDYLWRASGIPRFFLWVGIVASMCGLIATLTRSSWLGLIVGFFVLSIGNAALFSRKEYSQKALIFLVVTFFGAVAFWPRSQSAAYSATVAGRLAEVKQITQGSYAPVSQRLLIWLSSWEMVENHPLVGKGWGCIELFYPFYQGPLLVDNRFKDLRTHANNCHNEILEYWSQLGSVGLGLMLWVWATFFRQVVSVSRRLDVSARALHWGLVGGVAGMLTDNMLNVSVHFAVPAFLFWWWVGRVYAQDPGAIQTRRFPLTGACRVGLAAAIVGLALLTVRSGCLWAGEVKFFEGFKKSKAGDLAGAAKSLKEAYDWHHMEVNNDYELANVYARMGDREKAIPMYQHASDANAGYDEIYFNRATLLSQMGQIDNAIRDYRLTLAINPTSHDAYNALAAIYFKDVPRNSDAIEELYHQGVRVYPRDRDFWNNLGYLYTKKEHWQSAYDAYHRALEIDPEYELAQRNIHVVAKNIPGLKEDSILALPERFSEVDRLMDAHRYEDARVKAAILCKNIPGSFRAWFLLGNAQFFSGHYPEAEAAYQQSIRIQPAAATSWQNLGVTLDHLNRPVEAEQSYRKVLELDPKNNVARSRLGIH
jgi:tetratricopeptide (TPR) repeat protein